jgi:D-3-phosphoglycerate dehydrogenase
MKRYRVVVVNLGYATYATEAAILAAVDAEVIAAARDCLTEADVVAAAAEADAILVREAPITRRVLEAMPRCRAIVRYGVGVDNIDLQAAAARGIFVANVPGYGTEEVSDHAVALLTACIRQLPQRDRAIRAGRFETGIDARIYRTTGKVLGLVGYGQIARAVHRKWRGFLPSRVLVCDPHVDSGRIAEEGAEAVALETLLGVSDYISLHAPLTAETRHMIDAAALGRMKPTAILVNTARGELVDESALVAALAEERILAAGLDVFENEPLPQGHPLTGLPNAVLSGHVGWYSLNAVQELQTRAAHEVRRVLAGESPQCWVNRWETVGGHA